jgi:cobalt-zinc-cadmium efflux system outer membrane protein
VATLVVTSAWLSGCAASAGRYQALREQAFHTPKASAQRAEASPVPDAVWSDAGELSLPRVLEVSLERNPTLTAMRAAWQGAVERYPQVTALSDPQFGYSHAPSSIDSDTSIFGQKIDASQHFPWPGKLALRGEAALGDAAAAGEDFEGSRRRLIRAVTEAFYTYQFVHRAIEINRTNQELLSEFQRIAERRYAAGLASKNDVLQAEVAHQHLVHRGIALRRERAVAQARLNTLCNFSPKHPLPAPPRDIPEPTSVPPLSLLESVALHQRPELQALEHSIGARVAEAKLAKREYFPDLSVNAGYNSLWEDSDKRTLVGVAINVPLQLGRRRAALNQARAKQRETEARLEELRARVLLEVSEAYDELEETRHVVRLYASSILPAARESLETARSGYETGANDFLTLVATEKSLHLAELTYEQALTTFQQGRARLEHALGESIDELEELQ